jgi:TonB family protein
MLFRIFVLLEASTIICTAQQKVGTLAIRYFEYGNEAKDKGRYREADSLYTESLKWGSYANTYYNRAWARESIGNREGFCYDLAKAASLGDNEAWQLHCMNCGTWTAVYKDASGMPLVDSTGYATKLYVQGSPLFKQYFYTTLNTRGDTIDDFVVYANGDTVRHASTTFEPAHFPGGWNEFDKYMKEKLYYPKQARNDNVQGRVFMAYDVTADGEVTNVRLLRGVEGLNDEALRFMRVLPKFVPAKQNGVSVFSHCRMSIDFNLYEDSRFRWHRYDE